MSITYPLTLPTTIGIAQITLRAVNVDAMAMSPFTLKQQVFKHPGERWEARVSIPPLRRDLLEPWVAFLVALRGRTGTFLMGDPNNTIPQGSLAAAATVTVASSGAVGANTLALTGLPNNAVGVLLPGDYFQLGSGATATLHKVLLSLNSDSFGAGTVTFWPALRRAVAPSEAVVHRNTVGRFRLNASSTEWAINNSNAYDLSFDAVEAI